MKLFVLYDLLFFLSSFLPPFDTVQQIEVKKNPVYFKNISEYHIYKGSAGGTDVFQIYCEPYQ